MNKADISESKKGNVSSNENAQEPSCIIGREDRCHPDRQEEYLDLYGKPTRRSEGEYNTAEHPDSEEDDFDDENRS